MQRQLIAATLLLVFLAGCNIPGAATPDRQKTPPADEVATAVALQLTALPTFTAMPLPTNTEVIPTQTQPAPTAPPTLTPPSPSLTPAISATPSTEDPRATLGEPSWRNPFDSGRGFGLNEPYEDDNTRFAVENGHLVMTGRKANGWHGWRLTSPAVKNYYLEAVMRTRACSGSDEYGLVLRAPDFDSGKGYYFGLTCDGRYTFGHWINTGVTDMIDLTQHPAIKTGENQENRIGIKLDGNHFTLYANGTVLQDFQDSSFTDAGYFGVWIAANRTAGFTVDVDEMARWDN